MPVRSILEIDVDDAAFQRFSALFTKYRDAVDKLPRAWGSVNQATAAGVNHFADMAAAMMAQAELLRKSTTEAEHLNRTVSSTGRGMGALARDTRDVARNISAATISLLKWTGITGALGGLLGAGGLFGIERLAQSASGLRRSSQGLGVTSAEQQAFGINFGRIVDPRGFLSSVNEALNDVTKRSSLYGAGLSENQLRGRDAAQVATELLPQLKRIVDQTPQGMLQQTLQARGLNQFISLEEAQRLRRTPSSELQGFTRGYNRDVKDLSLTDDQLRKWQDFNVQLDRAGTNIKNIFIDGLTGLAEPLGHLSTAFSDAVGAFLKSDSVKEWIDATAGGLHQFADYVGSKEFKEDTKSFVEGVGALSHKITDVLKMLGIIPDSGPPKAATGSDVANSALAVGGLGALLGARFGPWGALVGGILGGIGGAARAQGRVPVVPGASYDEYGNRIGTGAPAGGGSTTGFGKAGEWWKSHAPSWLGGPAGRTSFSGRTSARTEPSGFTDPRIAAAFGVIDRGESGGRNVNNFMYNRPGAHHMGPNGVEVGYTAGGYHQLLDTNWIKYATKLGVDTKKWPRAIDAPGPVQDAVAEAMYKVEGPRPWTSGAGGSVDAGRLAKISRAMQAASAVDAVSSPYAAIGAPGVKVNSSGEPYSVELERASSKERANVASAYAAIKSGGWGGKTTPELDRIRAEGAGMSAAVRVEVHNQTGGSAVVTGSQVAQ